MRSAYIVMRRTVPLVTAVSAAAAGAAATLPPEPSTRAAAGAAATAPAPSSRARRERGRGGGASSVVGSLMELLPDGGATDRPGASARRGDGRRARGVERSPGHGAPGREGTAEHAGSTPRRMKMCRTEVRKTG